MVYFQYITKWGVQVPWPDGKYTWVTYHRPSFAKNPENPDFPPIEPILFDTQEQAEKWRDEVYPMGKVRKYEKRITRS